MSGFDLLNVKRQDIVDCLMSICNEGTRNDLAPDIEIALKQYLAPMLQSKDHRDLCSGYKKLEKQKKELLSYLQQVKLTEEPEKNLEQQTNIVIGEADLEEDRELEELMNDNGSIEYIDYNACLLVFRSELNSEGEGNFLIKKLLEKSDNIERRLKLISRHEECYRAFVKSLEQEDKNLSPNCVKLYGHAKKFNTNLWREGTNGLELEGSNVEVTSKFVINIMCLPNTLSFNLLVPEVSINNSK